MKRLLIVVGSKNDIPHLKESIKLLEQSKIKFQVKIISAHRNIGQLVRELEPKKLKKEGVDQKYLKKIKIPVGIDIGAQTPEEIAISIAAEIISVTNKDSIGTAKFKRNP